MCKNRMYNCSGDDDYDTGSNDDGGYDDHDTGPD